MKAQFQNPLIKNPAVATFQISSAPDISDQKIDLIDVSFTFINLVFFSENAEQILPPKIKPPTEGKISLANVYKMIFYSDIR